MIKIIYRWKQELMNFQMEQWYDLGDHSTSYEDDDTDSTHSEGESSGVELL